MVAALILYPAKFLMMYRGMLAEGMKTRIRGVRSVAVERPGGHSSRAMSAFCHCEEKPPGDEVVRAYEASTFGIVEGTPPGLCAGIRPPT